MRTLWASRADHRPASFARHVCWANESTVFLSATQLPGPHNASEPQDTHDGNHM